MIAILHDLIHQDCMNYGRKVFVGSCVISIIDGLYEWCSFDVTDDLGTDSQLAPTFLQPLNPSFS